jgi:hypothetical protein
MFYKSPVAVQYVVAIVPEIAWHAPCSLTEQL